MLTGILVLFLVSIKLSKAPEEYEEQTYDMIIAPEELMEEKDVVSATSERAEIETNKAYNEAEKFISSIENENRQLTETTEGKLKEMNEAMENSKLDYESDGNAAIAKAEFKKTQDFSNSESEKQQQAIVEGGNKNTTISYRLVGRQDLNLPNPVYTCFGSGRVVINIEVNDLGNITKATYNKAASTTSNECLIDAAIEYALEATFSSDASRKEQLGSITFNFPGQK